MPNASVFWGADVGEVLIFRPPDIQNFFRLAENESPFIEFVDAFFNTFVGTTSFCHIMLDEPDMEKEVDITQSLREETDVSVEIAAAAGARIGGQMRGRSRNSTELFGLSDATNNQLRLKDNRVINELVRRSIVIYKPTAGDAFKLEFHYRKVPVPLIWLPESDLGDLVQVRTSALAGSEFHQPNKSAGDEYHQVTVNKDFT